MRLYDQPPQRMLGFPLRGAETALATFPAAVTE